MSDIQLDGKCSFLQPKTPSPDPTPEPEEPEQTEDITEEEPETEAPEPDVEPEVPETDAEQEAIVPEPEPPPEDEEPSEVGRNVLVGITGMDQGPFSIYCLRPREQGLCHQRRRCLCFREVTDIRQVWINMFLISNFDISFALDQWGVKGTPLFHGHFTIPIVDHTNTCISGILGLWINSL